MSRIVFSVISLVISFAFILAFGEIGLRLWNGISPFEIVDFRSRNFIDVRLKGRVLYDPNLGWVHASNASFDDGNSTLLDHGIRKSAPDQTTVAEGGVLVVGSSYTAGAGVSDLESWPAHLHSLSGETIYNAAVGGYAADQIVLRAEDLLPKIKPEVLIVGLLRGTILWTGYSRLTHHKPYFLLEDGKLVRPQAVVPGREAIMAPPGFFARYGGYFFVVDQIMAAIDPQSWYARDPRLTIRTPAEPIALTCALLNRLERKASKQNTRLILVTLLGPQEAMSTDTRSTALSEVSKCAADLGYSIASHFPIIKQAQDVSEEAFVRHYKKEGPGVLGHLSSFGNKKVAELVYQTLQEQPAIRSATLSSDAANPAELSNTENLFTYSEALEAVFSASAGGYLVSRPESGNAPRSYQLKATGRADNAPVSSQFEPVRAGLYSWSMEVKPANAEYFTINISDDASRSASATFHFPRTLGYLSDSVEHFGRDKSVGIEKLANGWFRIWMVIRMPDANIRYLLSLGDEYGKIPDPLDKTSIDIRAVKLETGNRPTKYVRPASNNVAETGESASVNLIASFDDAVLDTSSTQTVALTVDQGFLFSKPATYTMTLSGSPSEHYSQISGSTIAKPGPHTLSMDISLENTSNVRLQLLDAMSNGVLGDYDLQTGAVSVISLGNGDIRKAGKQVVDSNWSRVSLTGNLAGGEIKIIVQAVDSNGNTNFKPNGERVKFRNAALVYGLQASN